MDSLRNKFFLFFVSILQIVVLNLYSSEKITVPKEVNLTGKPATKGSPEAYRGVAAQEEDLSVEGLGPTWLFNVPTADILHKNVFNSGFLYLDVGLTKANDLEVGLHGIKYQLIKGKEKNPSFSIGVSLFSGLYPYGVFSQMLTDDIRIHYGVSPFPYFVFGAIEVPIDTGIKGIFEIKDGFDLGLRFRFEKRWTFDFGFGFGFYANRTIFPDFLNFDSFAYEFDTELKSFIIISACYSGNII